MDEDLDVHVPADRGHQVVPAFPVTVPVPGRDDHRHGVVRDPNAGCDRKRPAVQAVEGIAFRIMGKLCCLTDAGDHQYLMGLEAKLHHGVLERLEDRKVAASGAPGRYLTAIVVECRHEDTCKTTANFKVQNAT